MKKKNNTEPQYVTKEILKKELTKSENRLNARIDGVEQRLDAKIDGVEQRLDAKIDAKVDSAVQSMKDYTDSRFTQVETRIDGLQQTMVGFTQKLDEQGNKMDRYFNGIVKLVEGLTGRITFDEEHLEDHEQRIKKLEEQTV